MSETWLAGDSRVSLPLREVVDGDPDAGLVLFDETLREVYSSPGARERLEASDAAGRARLRDALASFRERLRRSDSVQPPGEIDLDATRRPVICATLTDVWCARGRWFVMRLRASGTASEPTIGRLRSRFRLTPREAEVALAVSKGLSNAEAALHLGICEKTVKNAVMEVFKKSGARNRVELTLKAHGVAVGRPPAPGA